MYNKYYVKGHGWMAQQTDYNYVEWKMHFILVGARIVDGLGGEQPQSAGPAEVGQDEDGSGLVAVEDRVRTREVI